MVGDPDGTSFAFKDVVIGVGSFFLEKVSNLADVAVASASAFPLELPSDDLLLFLVGCFVIFYFSGLAHLADLFVDLFWAVAEEVGSLAEALIGLFDLHKRVDGSAEADKDFVCTQRVIGETSFAAEGIREV